MVFPWQPSLHPSAIISPTAQVKHGSTILANAVIHTFACISTGCIINTGAIVEHDCVIKDFVNISPNCAMAGHCRVESRAVPWYRKHTSSLYHYWRGCSHWCRCCCHHGYPSACDGCRCSGENHKTGCLLNSHEQENRYSDISGNYGFLTIIAEMEDLCLLFII